MITATIVFLVVLALVYAAMIVAELEFIASEREKIYELTFIKVQAILQYEQQPRACVSIPEFGATCCPQC